MSKFLCDCGHVIIDQTDNLSYKADFIPDQHQEYLYQHIPDALAGLIKATQEGRRTDWIRQNFCDGYPIDLTDESLVADLIGRYYLNSLRQMYQCEQCGRLWVQIGKANKYASFLPEDETGRDILRGEAELQ
jgi:hypothetical protein